MNDSRTVKFLKNTGATALGQIITMIAGFIIPRVMLTYYGSEINGLVTSLTQFVSYFNLVEAGLSGAAVYSLYKPLSEHDTHRVSIVVSTAKRFYFQAGALFSGLVLLMAVVYPSIIKVDALSPLQIGTLVIIIGVNGSLEFFALAKYRALLTADQKTYVISLSTLLSTITNTACIALFSRIGFSIIIVRLIATSALLIRTVILICYVRKHYEGVTYNEASDKSALNKRWDALYLQILGAVQTGAPTVILTLVTMDLKLVSVYSVFHMVTQGINSILSIFISGLSASFGDVIIRGEKDTLKNAYGEFELAYYMVISVVYAVAYVMIIPFIKLYTNNVTDTVYVVPVYGFIFIVNGILNNLKTPQGMLVISAGLYKETRIQTTIQGAIAVIGGIALTSWLGITGIMLALIASNIYRCIDLLFFIPRHVTGLPIQSTLKRWGCLLLSFTIIAVSSMLVQLSISNFAEWTAVAVAWCLFSILIVLSLTLITDRKMLMSIAKRLARLRG